jgi:hypothetical protein
MPPITKIVKNLVEEVIGRKIHKNWIAHFVRQYSSRLKSLYLRNIDNLHVKSEYGPHLEHFFDLVTSDFNVILVPCILLWIIMANIPPLYLIKKSDPLI